MYTIIKLHQILKICSFWVNKYRASSYKTAIFKRAVSKVLFYFPFEYENSYSKRVQNEELLFKDLIYAFLNYKFEILSYRFVLLHIFLLICLWIYWYTFWNIKSCKRYRCCLGNVYEYIDNTRSGGMYAWLFNKL